MAIKILFGVGDEADGFRSAGVIRYEGTVVAGHSEESSSCSVSRRGRKSVDSGNLIRIRTTTLGKHCVSEELYGLFEELALGRTEDQGIGSEYLKQGANVFQVRIYIRAGDNDVIHVRKRIDVSFLSL